MLAVQRIGYSDLAFAKDGSLWWIEARPEEASRGVVVRCEPGSQPAEVLGRPWDARNRVHEYGGAALCLVDDGGFVFTELTDGRLYHVAAKGVEPRPITPACSGIGADRFACPTVVPVRGAVIAVRERHAVSTVARELVMISLEAEPSEPLVLFAGSDFVSSPSVSPCGSKLAFLTWDHPLMPWDGCQLRLMDLGDRTSLATLAGGCSESLQQPRWSPDGRLYVLSDRSGWWNLYRCGPDGLEEIWPVAEECGEPEWLLGMSTYSILNDREAVIRHDGGAQRLTRLDLRTGSHAGIDLPTEQVIPHLASHEDVVAVPVRLAADEPAIVLVNTKTHDHRVLAASGPHLDPSYLATPNQIRVRRSSEEATIPGRLYLPHSPDHTGDAGQPPWVVFAHGGPTWRGAATRAEISYFTSRGMGVIDVDYAGSSGWGRRWRQEINGRWGVRDVADCVAAAQWLLDQGLAERGRIAIRGGSAGGWTALGAVATADIFGAAVSLCGVFDAQRLSEQTHDFESHYLDTLIGPLPQMADRYRERSPLHRVARIRCPVLVMQGDEDPVVPAAQATAMIAALAENGVAHAYIAFPGERHGLARADHRARAFEAELAFYGQSLGFDTPGVPRIELRVR